jgi:hypothetical protein
MRELVWGKEKAFEGFKCNGCWVADSESYDELKGDKRERSDRRGRRENSPPTSARTIPSRRSDKRVLGDAV